MNERLRCIIYKFLYIIAKRVYHINNVINKEKICILILEAGIQKALIIRANILSSENEFLNKSIEELKGLIPDEMKYLFVNIKLTHLIVEDEYTKEVKTLRNLNLGIDEEINAIIDLYSTKMNLKQYIFLLENRIAKYYPTYPFHCDTYVPALGYRKIS